MMPESFVESCLAALADMFYPQRCVGCDARANDVLCRGCFEGLPLVGEPRCGRCGFPTAFETPLCEECKDADYGFTTARAALRYEGAGKEVVHALKYRAYFPVVGKLITPLLAAEVGGENFDAVVPVPIHPSRRRKRGFNQAEVMARSLAGELKTPLEDRLRVVRRTRDQVELTAAGRRENVRGAFRASGRFAGKVLLVDDVFTTGATMSECAAELLGAGASEVHAASLCRTC